MTQTSTGDCTANVVGGDANLNCGAIDPPPRVIPKDDYSKLHDYLAGSPATVIVSATGSQESYDFADALFALYKDANWKMQDGAVRGTAIVTGPPLHGVTVKVHGSTPLKGREEITGDLPEDRTGRVLSFLKINPDLDRRPNYPEGVVEVFVADQAKVKSRQP